MKVVARVVALALLVSCAVAQTAQTTLLNTIRNSPVHTVFSRLLPASSPALDEIYGNPGVNSTVFAPTDPAFFALIGKLGLEAPSTPEDAIAILTSLRSTLDDANAANPNIPSFSDLLYYHMFPVRRGLFRGSRGKQFNTGFTGTQLGVSDTDQIQDGDPESDTPITTRNIRHVNGFLNVIQEVLLPAPAAVVAALVNPAQTTPSPSTSVIPAEVSPSAQASEVLPSPTALTSVVVAPSMPVPAVSPPAAASSAPAESSSAPAESSSAPASSSAPMASVASVAPVPSDATPAESVDPSAEMSMAATPETVSPVVSGSVAAESDDDSAEATEEPSDGGVCFPASAEVTLADGSSVRMDKLEAGHSVMHNAEKMASEIFLFTHRTSTKRTRFVRLSTSCGNRLTLTASHYIRSADGHLIAAGDAKVGQTEVRTLNGVCKITKSERVPGVGLYAPHSIHGDLVVDGVVVSGYSKAIHPAVAHALLFPVRWFVKTFGSNEPLGATFYNGADSILRFLPKGQATVASV